jgi:hypothetical protein
MVDRCHRLSSGAKHPEHGDLTAVTTTLSPFVLI